VNLQEIGWRGVEWIDLAQDMDSWWVLVNTVMNFRFFWLNEEILASQEGPCFMELVSRA
jgi:hypothetical protein